jgi:hypothetical protein
MKKWLEGWKYGVFLIILVVSALLIMDFNSRLTEFQRLSKQRNTVSAQVTSLAQTESSLKTQIAYATSAAGVMQWAYEDGHWVREGDNLVVPVSPGNSTPAPTPTTIVTAAPMSNWQLWLTLFVDPGSPVNAK